MIADEYSKALFELVDKKDLKDVYNELSIICEALDLNPDAKKVLTYPNISLKNKKDIIKEVTKDCNSILTNFFYVLLDNDEFKLIDEIKESFKSLATNLDNICDVLVTSSKKLNDEQISTITNLLKQKVGNKKININNIVDETLIGGLICKYNGEIIDLSIKTKLDILKSSL